MARAHAIRRSTTPQGGGRKRFSSVTLLVVAVLSFAGGVLFGRREAPPLPAVAVTAVTPRIAVVREGASGAMGAAAAAANSGGKDLTFYETLTRESPAALGSGINSSGATAAPPTPPVETVTVVPVSAPVISAVAPSPPAGGVSPVAATRPPPAPAPKAASGSYILQAAAYKTRADADKLKGKLVAKGYPVFIEAADLGAKGKWQRVYVGPFGDSGAAEAARQKLAAQEKISAMARKR